LFLKDFLPAPFGSLRDPANSARSLADAAVDFVVSTTTCIGMFYVCLLIDTLQLLRTVQSCYLLVILCPALVDWLLWLTGFFPFFNNGGVCVTVVI
jgi:hypothetical protein